MAEVLSMGKNNRSVSFVFTCTTAILRIDGIGYSPILSKTRNENILWNF
jgi:hypothetical protein